MNKYLTLVLSIFLAFPFTFSQSRFNAGGSFNINFPVGSFSDLVKTGTGGTGIFEYVFNEKVSGTLSASYLNFPGNSEGIAVQGVVLEFSVNSIPVMAGVRYYFSKEFFGILEAGADFIRVSADIYDVYSNDKISTDYQTKYSANFGLGYRYKLAEASALELSGLYQLVQDNFNSIVLRMGVMIFLDNI